MKLTLLLGASLMALSIGSAPAGAVTFSFTGATTTYTIPTTGLYQIDAWGAQGGNEPSHTGGLGAHVAGEFNFTAGLVLTIAVGGAGGNATAGAYGGGGGGGSFVVNNITPLAIAGGGGGAYTANGGAGLVPAGGAGTGGTGDTRLGGGGGGFNGAGGAASIFGKAFPLLTGGTKSFINSGPGGFGGGGGGGGYGGGGGGGFNGGNAADPAGFGGTSFNAGANQVNQSGVRSGNGLIDIVLLSAAPEPTDVPEPGSMALLAAGLGGLGALRRRKGED